MHCVSLCMRLLFLMISLLVLSGCRFGRMLVIQMPGQHDFKLQEYHTVPKGNRPVFHFQEISIAEQERFAQLRIPDSKNLRDSLVFQHILEKNKVAAFVLIREDTLLYEKYFRGYPEDRMFTSFSVAKSFVATLVGIAIQDGYIHSVNDYVLHYLPELKGKKFADSLRIIHLLEHTSGLRFREIPFNPTGRMTALYHRRHQEGSLKNMRWDRMPGQVYEYQDVNTFLAGLILEKASGIPLQQYLSEKIWQKLGMESDAQWSADRKNGMVRPFCCLQTRTRDLARFGRLYLHRGKWEGEQIVPEHWIERATWCDGETDPEFIRPRPFQWQTGGYPDCDFNARGLYDQFIYVNPQKKVVLVMLCDKHYVTRIAWRELFRRLCKDYL